MDTISTGPAAGREPALDGLRALAVVAVLVYHQPARWLPGGFLGVSTFFTLSGFLITRLLLHELGSSGRIGVRSFYVRRFRRLAPAALMTTLAIVVAWTVADRSLARGDVIASLSDVQNWWLLHEGDGYASLFADPSPFQHFWSLAIEEQFYLAYPVVVVGLVAVSRHRPPRFAAGLGLLACASFVVAALSPEDVAYYATTTRAGELLVGGMLAVATMSSRTAPALSRWGRSGPGRIVGVLAIVAMVVLWGRTRLDDPWLFPWATLVNAVATCAVIVECCTGTGARRWFASRPAAGLGRVSYGVYLVHWPVYLLVPASAVAWGWAVFPVRAAITLGLALVMFAVIEEPVRTGRAVRGAAFPLAGAAVSMATIAVAFAVAPGPGPQLIDASAIDAARLRLLAAPEPASTTTLPPSTTTPRPPTASAATPSITITTPATATETDASPSTVTEPPAATPLQRVLFVGDSTSWTISLGVVERLAPKSIDVQAFPAVGCGLGGDAPIRYLNREPTADVGCATWLEQLPEVVHNFRPDVVFVVGGLADLSDRQLPDGSWSHVGVPAYDEWLAARMRATADVLTATGATLVWATLPHLDLRAVPGATGAPPFVENDPQRAERYNAILHSVVASDLRVHLVDLAGFLAARPGGEFAPGLRPDGVHIDSRQFPDVVDFFVDAAYTSLATAT